MSQVSRTAKDIFVAASEAPPAERSALLDEVCAGDAALRQHVEMLLKVHDEPDSLLDRPRIDLGFAAEVPAFTKTVIKPEQTESPGTVIGPYKLLEQIGEGGFGIVYMADQQAPVRRRVAIKIIKPGMDTKQVLARFKAELQALSLMDHPNIARALDAGATDSGRPYFVMELVRGVPITDYCDQNKLPVNERLDLFVQVCHAVQHAHQKGIIHRDIKPSNVLVTMQDGRPVPKVIDFGVAKAIDRQLTQETIFTRFAEMIGTPLYMSPEQAEMTSLDIDTRSDIYSLGVLLYELLTGTTPFERERLKQAAFDEIRRIIREEEPAKPSTRISTLGANSAAVAAHRHIEPHRLGQLMRGDLDWIVMKALDKDRTRRYETANGLAMDLQRHLADEPVLAGPPSAAYRFHKFARRNRAALMMAAVVTLALLLGIVGTTWQAIVATKAERLAQTRLDSESRALAAEAEQRAHAEANFQTARRAVDEMYTQVAEKWMARQPQMQPLQREFLQKALRFYEDFAHKTAQDPSLRLEAAQAYRRVADIQHQLGQAAEAERAFERAIDGLQTLADEFPAVPQYRQILAETLDYFGVLLADTGRHAQNEIVVRRALDLQEKLAAENPGVPEYRRDLGRGYYFLGDILGSLHRASEKEKAVRSALAIQTKLVAEFPAVHLYRQHLAESHRSLREFREAAAILEKLVADFPDDPQHRSELAYVYYWHAKPLASQEAEPLVRKALALLRKLANDFPAVSNHRYDLVRSLELLSANLVDTNRTAEAVDSLREAVRIGDQLAAESPEVVFYRDRLAGVYTKLANLSKHPDEAEKLLSRALAIFEALTADFPSNESYRVEAGHILWQLGNQSSAAGRREDAEKFHRQALAVFEKLAVEIPTNAYYRLEQGFSNWYLGGVLQDAGRLNDAEERFEKALAVYSALAADFPEDVEYRSRLVRSENLVLDILTKQEKFAEAEKFGREAFQRADELAASNPHAADCAKFRADLQFRWAQAQASNKQLDEACNTFQQAVESYEKLVIGSPQIRGELTQVYLSMAQTLASHNRPQQAEQAYQKAAEVAPNDADALNLLAWSLASNPHPEFRVPPAAVKLAEKAVALAPNNGIIVNTLGVAHYRAGDWKAAIAALEKSMELRGGGSTDWFFLGMCYWQLGEKDLAAKWYKVALRQMAESPSQSQNAERKQFRAEAARLIGLSETEPTHKTDEVALGEALVQLHPKSSSYMLRGEAYANSEQWDRAPDDFAKAIEMGSKSYLPWYDLALVRLAKDDRPDFQAACADMVKSFAQTEDGPTANFVAWTCALGRDALKDFAPAVALAEKAARIDPNSAQFATSLGAILYRAGKFEEARIRLDVADRLSSSADPRRSPPAYIWFLLAMTHQRLGHVDEAKKWFDKAREVTDKALEEHDADSTTLIWNRRLTLGLLRREAEEQLGVKTPPTSEATPAPKPAN